MRRLSASGQSGFTLLEVLVALAILSLVLVTLGQTLGSAINAYSHLDLKTRAWLVASDKLVEMQVYARWPSVGTQTQTLEQNGESWQVTTQVSKGPFNGTRRVDIRVTLQQDADKDGALYTLSSLLGEPSQQQSGNAATHSGNNSSNHSSNNSSNNSGSANRSASNSAANAAAPSWENP